MYSVQAIADSILRIAKKSGKALTPLQLMKLVYIAHGFHLAMKDASLFNARIEAWKYGPVIPDLYKITKAYGKEPIPLNKIRDQEAALDPETVSFLEKVFDKYGNLSAYSLSALTHQAGTPWAKAYSEDVYGKEIPNSSIAEHYKGLILERGNPAAA